MRKSASQDAEPPSKRIDARVTKSPDWQGEMLSRIRRLIEVADPEVVEERKWRKPSKPAGVPVWYHDGIICHAEAFKDHVRLTFLKGASLKDPKGLFNSGLEGNAMRAIIIHEGNEIDDEGTMSLVRAAAALNASSARGR